MNFTTITDDLNIIQSLIDEPNDIGGLTADQLKSKFDNAGNIIKDFINNILLNELESTTDSSSGADKIGITSISDLDGNTLQSIIESLRNKLKSTTNSSSGADFINSTGISGLSGSTVQSLLESLKLYIDTHKTSGDHDGRYYTETEINNLLALYTTITDITNNRKLDDTGNFTGSWFGVSNPALADPGIAGVVEQHTSQLADIVTKQGDINQLNTTDKSSVVNAIKEVKTQTNSKADQASLNVTNGTVTSLQSQVSNIGSSTPKGAYATLSALQTAFPTGTTGIYIISADNKWYYWSGSAWTAGGTYQNNIFTDDFNYVNTLNNTNDLNVITKDGLYFIAQGSTPSNCPVTPSCVLKQMTIMGGAYAIQLLYPFNSDDFFYMRRIVHSTPSSNTAWLNIRNVINSNLDRQFNYGGILNNSNDLNNISILKSGIYLIQNSSIPANCPYTNTCILIEYNYLGNYAHQVIYDFNDPTITFTRKVDNTTPTNNTSWISSKPLTGKNLLTIGDSITYGLASTNHYQDKMSQITGATIINQGYSGAKYALKVNHEPWNDHSFYTYSSTLDLTNIDYLWVMYGINDYNNSIPIGDMTTDEYTVCGAIFKGLQNFMSRKPTLKIFVSTPIFSATYDGTNLQDVDVITNSIGLKLIDYVNAIKSVYQKFRIPVFDGFNECGINYYNQATFLADKLHPNNDGNDLIGIRFGNFIKKYV
jgi:hypothetical protein